MAAKGKLAIVYLEPNALYFYGSSASSVLTLPFAPQVVLDLEVLKKDQLENQVASLVDTNKILPCEYIIILSDKVYFEKEILKQEAAAESGQTPNMEEKIAKFLNVVPFEEVATVRYPKDKSVIVYAVNKQFYEAIKEVFEKKGFNTLGIVPSVLLGKEIFQSGQLDEKALKAVHEKENLLKQYSFLLRQEDMLVNYEAKSTKPHNKRLMALSSVFALLIVVFVILLIKTTQMPQPVINSVLIPTSTVVAPTNPQSSVSSQNQTGTSSAFFDPSALLVQIITPQSLSKQAGVLKNNLQEAGFKNSIVIINQNTTTSKTTIVISSDVLQDAKNSIVEETKKSFPNLSVIESASSKTVIITLGAE